MIVVVERILVDKIKDQNTVKKKGFKKKKIKIFFNKNLSFFKFFLGFLIKKGKFFKAFFFFKFIILSLKNYNLKPFFFSQYVLYQIKPLLGLRDYYVGRTKYRVPFFIYNFTSIKIGVRWLIKSVNERSENLFKNKFLLEILELLEQKKKK